MAPLLCAPRLLPRRTLLPLPCLLSLLLLGVVGPTPALARLSVLLNVTEQLDPLVAMNLVHLKEQKQYTCNDTVNGTVTPVNGAWTSHCDAPGINITSLTVSALDAAAVPVIPSSISNIFTLTQLTMAGIGLRSSLPSTLGFMGNMLHLDLSNNRINGSFPGTLCVLTTLTFLDLSNNDLSGEINPALTDIPSLAHLNLGSNNFSGPILSTVAGLPALTFLDLSGRPPLASAFEAAGVRALKSPSALSRFSFSDNLTAGIMANLSSLQHLSLANTDIQVDLSAFNPLDSPLTTLQYLDLRNTHVEGQIPFNLFVSLTMFLADNASHYCGTNNFCNSTLGNTTFICTSVCPDLCFCPSPFPLGAIIGIVVGLTVVVLAGLVATYYALRARQFSDGVEVHGVRRFTLQELEEATEQFAYSLGKGGFGEVFKGTVWTKEGTTQTVAVKRTKAERRRNMKKFDSGFRNEILVLSGVRHRNLVELIGYSSRGSDILLVYEFVPQGSLDDLLKKEEEGQEGAPFDNGTGSTCVLTWERRIKIAFGAAQGLDYLHSGVQPPIVHRDIKSSNILVDSDFAAKVADFGLSKIRPEMDTELSRTLGVEGTLGYIDPEYAATLKPTERSDVYSFGVVLLELATGWRAIGGPENKHIIYRVAQSVNASGFESVLAPAIKRQLEQGNVENGQSSPQSTEGLPSSSMTTILFSGEGKSGGANEVRVATFREELFQRLVKLGMQCCAKDSSSRPSMRAVAKALGEIAEGSAEDSSNLDGEELFDGDMGEEVVLLSHNLGGEEGATVAFVMDSQAGPR